MLDNICRVRLSEDPSDEAAQRDIGEVAGWIGADPSRAKKSGDNAGYLLIREWGAGFWSDVFQIAAHLFAAEASGRTPVVYWGPHSRFSDDPDSDAFQTFFEPVSDSTIAEIATAGRHYFPDRWNAGNLGADIPDRRQAQPYLPALLFRTEDVVVGCGYGWIHEVLPWSSGFWNFDDPAAWRGHYRRIFQSFLRPRETVQREADAFWEERLAGWPSLAVHVRGADKIAEDAASADLTQAYRAAIDRHLDERPDSRLYLMTDSLHVVEDWRARYGTRIADAPAIRTGSDMGVHFQPHPDRHQLGREVLRDALIAAKCDAFVGTGFSNVSHAVTCLKDWTEGAATLLGRDVVFRRHIAFYDPAARRHAPVGGQLF